MCYEAHGEPTWHGAEGGVPEAAAEVSVQEPEQWTCAINCGRDLEKDSTPCADVVSAHFLSPQESDHDMIRTQQIFVELMINFTEWAFPG